MPAPPRMGRSLGTRPRPSRARAGLIQATPLVGTFQAELNDNSAQPSGPPYTVTSWCPPGQTFNPATLSCEGLILPSGIEQAMTGAPPDFSWMEDDEPTEPFNGNGNGTIPPLPQPREQDFPWGILAAGIVAVVLIGRR